MKGMAPEDILRMEQEGQVCKFGEFKKRKVGIVYVCWKSIGAFKRSQPCPYENPNDCSLRTEQLEDDEAEREEEERNETNNSNR